MLCNEYANIKRSAEKAQNGGNFANNVEILKTVFFQPTSLFQMG